jgi:hypothetical protein
VPKIGRRKTKRHKSKGEEESARKYRRKKKDPDYARENSEEETDQRSLKELLWGNGGEVPEDVPDDGDIYAEGAPEPFTCLQPEAAEALLVLWDEDAGEDAATLDSPTKSCSQNSNSDEDLSCLQLESDAEPANVTTGAPNFDYIRRVRPGRFFLKGCLTCGKIRHNLNNCPDDVEPANEEAATKSAEVTQNNDEGGIMAFRHHGVLQNQQAPPSNPKIVPPGQIRKSRRRRKGR